MRWSAVRPSMTPPLPSRVRFRRSTTFARRRTIGAASRRIFCEDSGVTQPPPDEHFVIRGRRVVTPGGVRAASVHIADGRIARVAGWEETPSGERVVDAGNLIVMPGLVDTHVHVNDPGRDEWE